MRAAAGRQDSRALLATGSIECWGANNSGQLGDGSPQGSSTPVSISGISNATALAVGANHACAVLGYGGVECWGDNTYGELGTALDPQVPLRFP